MPRHLLVRSTLAGILVFATCVEPTSAQNGRPVASAPGGTSSGPAARVARATAGQPAASPITQPVAAGNNAAAGAASAPTAPTAPFPPLTPDQQAQLDRVLVGWQNATAATKTLDCSFLKLSYDSGAAPAGVAATKGSGVIKYAAPDRGLIHVEQIVFFDGMGDNQKPKYQAHANRFGEHWVCTGADLIEFDHNQKQCKINRLPEEMRGKNIMSSPLPFVFSLDARRLKERFWVRQAPGAPEGSILLEVHPKRAEDRRQYTSVMVALDPGDFTPLALRMYAPNFNVQTANIFDHYEFRDVKRNSWLGRMKDFAGNFIVDKAPTGWKVVQQ